MAEQPHIDKLDRDKATPGEPVWASGDDLGFVVEATFTVSGKDYPSAAEGDSDGKRAKTTVPKETPTEQHATVMFIDSNNNKSNSLTIDIIRSG